MVRLDGGDLFKGKLSKGERSMRKKMAIMLVMALALGWSGVANAAITLDDSDGLITLTTGPTDTTLIGTTLTLKTTTAETGWDITISVISGTTTLGGTLDFTGLSWNVGVGTVGTVTTTVVRMSGGNFGFPTLPTSGPGTLMTGMTIGGGNGVIRVFDHIGGVSLGEVSVVPEPMTVGLLALGGLGLLRRRRVS